jgi:hypothetical protein
MDYLLFEASVIWCFNSKKQKMKTSPILIIACSLLFFACNKVGINSTNDNNTLPFIEFTIKGKTTKVDCEKIVLGASTNSEVSAGGGTSASTGFFFNFSFPSKSSKVDSLSPGYFPLRDNGNSYYQLEDIFQFNFRFPSTPTKENYYISLGAPIPTSNPGADEPRNEITKITKGALENNRQTYIVEGRYVARVELIQDGSIEIVKGSYRFKLHTLPE